MHDIRWIRENPEEFDRGLTRRGLPRQSSEVLALDKEWRGLQTAAEEAQAVRNRLSREIGIAKARGESAGELLARIARGHARRANRLAVLFPLHGGGRPHMTARLSSRAKRSNLAASTFTNPTRPDG